VVGHFILATIPDRWAAFCFLCLFYAAKRLSNLNDVLFTFDFLRCLIANQRCETFGDKTGGPGDRVLWIGKDDFIATEWLSFGAELAPIGDRDFMLPAPARSYTEFANKPCPTNTASKWLIRLWQLTGYSFEEAYRLRRVHAFRRSLIQYSVDSGERDEMTVRMAGWKDPSMVRVYSDKSSAVLDAKSRVLAYKKTEFFNNSSTPVTDKCPVASQGNIPVLNSIKASKSCSSEAVHVHIHQPDMINSLAPVSVAPKPATKKRGRPVGTTKNVLTARKLKEDISMPSSVVSQVTTTNVEVASIISNGAIKPLVIKKKRGRPFGTSRAAMALRRATKADKSSVSESM
jgi:hypothetical protein